MEIESLKKLIMDQRRQIIQQSQELEIIKQQHDDQKMSESTLKSNDNQNEEEEEEEMVNVWKNLCGELRNQINEKDEMNQVLDCRLNFDLCLFVFVGGVGNGGSEY